MSSVEIRSTQVILPLDSKGIDLAALWLPEMVEIGATGERPVFFNAATPSVSWSLMTDSSLRYELKVPSRITVTGSIKPDNSGFELNLSITNLSKTQWQQVLAAVCLQLTPAFSFLDLKRERTGCVVNSQFRTLNDMKTIGGKPEYLFAFVKNHPPQQLHGDPLIPGAKWSHTVEKPDDGFIYVRSTDTKKTLWLAWSDSQFLQSNTTAAYGCIHSNPFFGNLSPGESSHRRGRLEVLTGSPLEAHQSFLKEFG